MPIPHGPKAILLGLCRGAITMLGGNRSTCIGHNPTTHEVQGEYEVCNDRLCYVEYGPLDDQTVAAMG